LALGALVVPQAQPTIPTALLAPQGAIQVLAHGCWHMVAGRVLWEAAPLEMEAVEGGCFQSADRLVVVNQK
jgi:hypothetical protein